VRFLANPLSTHRGFTPRMGTLSVRFEESTLFFTHLREHRSHLAKLVARRLVAKS
jgi:hypothetical protein